MNTTDGLTETRSPNTGKKISKFSVFFRIGMLWRILYGFLKFVLGVILYTVASINPANLFYRLMRHEIIEDPEDLFIRLASPVVDRLSSDTTFFAAVYLIFWGIVDVFLAINLLREKIWAFRVALVLINVFILYEIYRVTHTHSLFLVYIICLDMLIVWLIYKEYMNVKRSNY